MVDKLKLVENTEPITLSLTAEEWEMAKFNAQKAGFTDPATYISHVIHTKVEGV